MDIINNPIFDNKFFIGGNPWLLLLDLGGFLMIMIIFYYIELYKNSKKSFLYTCILMIIFQISVHFFGINTFITTYFSIDGLWFKNLDAPIFFLIIQIFL
jgi:hypothetical protein